MGFGSQLRPPELARRRWQVTAKALAVTAEAGILIDRVCDFVGEPIPDGPIARDLVTRLFTRLDGIPAGALRTLTDFFDAAASPDLAAEYDPPLTQSVIDAVFDLEVDLAGLTDVSIRSAAQQFGMTNASVNLAWQALSADPCWAGSLGNGPGRRDAAAVINAVNATPAHRWSEVALLVLRAALGLHMARIGDGFLRLSEWRAPTLPWQQGSDALLATHPVAAAEGNLEARITVIPPDPHDHGARVVLFTGRQIPTAPTYRWQTGWISSTTDSTVVDVGHERSLPAARWAAELAIFEQVARIPF